MSDPNYPAGAEYDSNAPWNETDVVLCRYCNDSDINSLCTEHNMSVDELQDSGICKITLCRDCYAQENEGW